MEGCFQKFFTQVKQVGLRLIGREGEGQKYVEKGTNLN